jgi:hypothetical protein
LFRFYLDENVTERLATALLRQGIDVVTAGRLGRKGISDAVHLLDAASNNRVLVTFEVKDITLLHEAWAAWSHAWRRDEAILHAGIMVIYPARSVSIVEIAREIERFGDQQTSIVGALWSWNEKVGWRRQGGPHED